MNFPLDNSGFFPILRDIGLVAFGQKRPGFGLVVFGVGGGSFFEQGQAGFVSHEGVFFHIAQQLFFCRVVLVPVPAFFRRRVLGMLVQVHDVVHFGEDFGFVVLAGGEVFVLFEGRAFALVRPCVGVALHLHPFFHIFLGKNVVLHVFQVFLPLRGIGVGFHFFPQRSRVRLLAPVGGLRVAGGPGGECIEQGHVLLKKDQFVALFFAEPRVVGVQLEQSGQGVGDGFSFAEFEFLYVALRFVQDGGRVIRAGGFPCRCLSRGLLALGFSGGEE